MIYRLVIFLALNFGALAIGGLFTREGVASAWYSGLAKAPWTPPGWVFGTAWSTIMILFSIYLAFLWSEVKDKRLLLILYSVQWILNVSWNPTFFYYHNALIGLILITGLTLLVAFLLAFYWQTLKLKSLLIAPYLIWLLIATSLNAFIVFKN